MKKIFITLTSLSLVIAADTTTHKREDAVSDLTTHLTTTSLSPICIVGEAGTGKDFVVDKFYEQAGNNKPILKGTLPTTGDISGAFKELLRTLYQGTDKSLLHFLVLNVTELMTFPTIGQFDTGLKNDLEKRKKEIQDIFAFLSTDTLILSATDTVSRSTLKLIYMSRISLPDEMEDDFSVIELAPYTGVQKTAIYQEFYPSATPKQISEHVLFYAELPGIKPGPLKKLKIEPLNAIKYPTDAPGSVNFVGVFGTNTQKDGIVGQIEARLIRNCYATNNLRRHAEPHRLTEEGKEESFRIPTTVAILKYPRQAFEREANFKLHFNVPGMISGPSAGLSCYLALVSDLFGRPVPSDVLCSGEIGLHGQVLPIGGELTKFRAAYTSGIRRFLLHPLNCKTIREAMAPGILDQVTLIEVLNVNDAEKAIFGTPFQDREHIEGVQTILDLCDKAIDLCGRTEVQILNPFGLQRSTTTGRNRNEAMAQAVTQATAFSGISITPLRDKIEAVLTGQFHEEE